MIDPRAREAAEAVQDALLTGEVGGVPWLESEANDVAHLIAANMPPQPDPLTTLLTEVLPCCDSVTVRFDLNSFLTEHGAMGLKGQASFEATVTKEGRAFRAISGELLTAVRGATLAAGLTTAALDLGDHDQTDGGGA